MITGELVVARGGWMYMFSYSLPKLGEFLSRGLKDRGIYVFINQRSIDGVMYADIMSLDGHIITTYVVDIKRVELCTKPVLSSSRTAQDSSQILTSIRWLVLVGLTCLAYTSEASCN